MFNRHRNWFLFGGVLLALGASLYTDPDSGLSTLLGWLALGQGVWALAASHWARKAFFDYAEANMQILFRKAREESTGAGLALIALSIFFYSFVAVFAPRAHASEFIPTGAITYVPVLKEQQVKFWKDHPKPEVLAGLVEQESCPSLKSKSCWNPTAKLKSDREEGAGIGQITRAYDHNGGIRFDALADLRSRHDSELHDWSWANVYSRADLQFRALVLMSKDNYNVFRNATSKLEFADAAYNGGSAGVQKERRACSLSPGCDPNLWFGHVSLHCLKSKQPLYGGRNACDINREHVEYVFHKRSSKYKELMT